MTIKEVEERTGLARSNVRFYEKERLISPARDESNGYRDYSEQDVEDIKKIAYLRTLGIAIEDIRSIRSGKSTLHEIIEKQNKVLEGQITGLQRAKVMCERMLAAENISYERMQVEQYVEELQGYWNDNRSVFKLDSTGFLYLWGSFITWAVITCLCLVIGLLFYTKLPPEIPVQWSDGAAVSWMDKRLIFAYPAVCAVIRYLMRPWLYAKLQMSICYGAVITDYLTNYMCFIVLSVEVFSILFVFGIVENIVVILVMDTVVFIGLLAVYMGRYFSRE